MPSGRADAVDSSTSPDTPKNIGDEGGLDELINGVLQGSLSSIPTMVPHTHTRAHINTHTNTLTSARTHARTHERVLKCNQGVELQEAKRKQEEQWARPGNRTGVALCPLLDFREALETVLQVSNVKSDQLSIVGGREGVEANYLQKYGGPCVGMKSKLVSVQAALN